MRKADLDNRFDGYFYERDDFAPLGCRDCAGCADCCRTTGDSIILDPYDMFLLTTNLHKRFEEMIEREIEIRMVDSLILPNLMLEDENDPQKESRCPFLDVRDRCSIHAFRPGLCRLFPLARYYEGSKFHYVLWQNECSVAGSDRDPVRISDWLGIEDLPRYEAFAREWHAFRKEMECRIGRLRPEQREKAARYILQLLYVAPYEEKVSFYRQFEERLRKIRSAFH